MTNTIPLLEKDFDYTKIYVEIEDIDGRDYPDFCDAFVAYAEYDGVEMTDEQIEMLSGDFVHEQIFDKL